MRWLDFFGLSFVALLYSLAGMTSRSKEVLNADEAAEFLGFNPYTVREKARLGAIPGRKIGREWRFSREALLEWIREGEVSHRRPGYVVVVTPDTESGGFLATVQGVPDVRGWGETEDEAVQDVRAALESASYADKYRTELP